jgi:adenylate cyclase
LERKLTAILCADVYGYIRLMGEDEEATLRTLSVYRKIIDSLIDNHRGRFVNSAGDSVLAEFTSVVEAVNCAVEIQNALKAENAGLPLARRMEFRIGINSGDVMVEGEQIYGDGVNVAARLESLADPGGVLISGIVHDQVRGRLPFTYEDLGAQQVKNIAEPLREWRVFLDGTTPSRQSRFIGRRYWRGGILSLTGLVIIGATIFLVQYLTLKPPRTRASIPLQEKPALSLPSIPSIAVLPFANLSGDPAQEYFSDGLTDLVITRLSKVPGLFIIARAPSFSYEAKSVTVQQVGRQLGVRTILEGSILRAGDRVRVNAELADATNGKTLWTQSFDQPLKDISDMQDDMVRGIVTTLGLLFKLDTLHFNVLRVDRDRQTDNLEAFDLNLRGLENFWKNTKDGYATARRLWQKAIALDPNYAEAIASVGWTYEMDVVFGFSRDPRADLKRASALAQKALALEDSSTMALALVSDNDRVIGRFDEAVRIADRLSIADPENSFSYWFLAEALDGDGRPDEAALAIRKAIRLDPALDELFSVELGFDYLHSGRYEQALSVLKRHISSYPNNLGGHLALSIAYVELGRNQDAHAEVAEVRRLSPRFALGPPELMNKDVAWRNRAFADWRKAGLK